MSREFSPTSSIHSTRFLIGSLKTLGSDTNWVRDSHGSTSSGAYTGSSFTGCCDIFGEMRKHPMIIRIVASVRMVISLHLLVHTPDSWMMLICCFAMWTANQTKRPSIGHLWLTTCQRYSFFVNPYWSNHMATDVWISLLSKVTTSHTWIWSSSSTMSKACVSASNRAHYQ